MRVALFLPCFNDTLFPETGVATVRVLRELGVEVAFPQDQTCCGQIHFNTGYRREAVFLMKRFLSVFGHAEAIVAPSASCVAMVREQYRELAGWAGENALVEGVEEMAAKTHELTEFLVGRLGVEDVGASFHETVTFHPTCHSIRSIDVGDRPLRLLRAVRGLELVPLAGAEECCGFGGTFALKNPDTSLAMMEDKIRNVLDSGARVLTAVDNSCLMHLAGGLKRRGLLPAGGQRARPGVHGGGNTAFHGESHNAAPGIRLLHLAEILASRDERPGT
ncbi:MAG: (Fe-S)-binding protein [Gemmatimonadota bacterium]